MEFLLTKTEDGGDLPLPARATPLSAGLDLYANVHTEVVILPGERKLVPTGVKIALPEGYEAQARPRSGLALKYGIGMPNSPATIDADYRGELKVILINWGSEPFKINRADRIAQIVINKIEMVEFKEVETLPESERGEGGFGHSGV
jgi:dUTP pyrophosphatase